jgi:peptidoglycan/LPS O-acetylase OafA/YrhL
VVAMNRESIIQWFGRQRFALGWPCLAAGLLLCWLPLPHFHDEVVGIGAALILVAILGTGAVKNWLGKNYWLWLGKQSYSLYLIHVPVVMAIVILFGGKVPIFACLSVIPVSIALAQIFHVHVELPSVALAQKLSTFEPKKRMVAVESQ